MINELILKNSPNSWLRNGFKKQCFMILFAVLYTARGDSGIHQRGETGFLHAEE